MKIYKYLPFESGKLIIENNMVLLNNPKNYNDPFDCTIKPSEEDEDKCFKMIINYYLFKEFSKIILEKKVKIPFWLLWVRWELKLFKKLMKKHPYYEKMPGFDGITQIVLKIYSEKNPSFKKEMEENKKVFSNKIKDSVDGIKESLLVSCFSTNKDSILMWSHYADKHKGLCIEFEVDNDNFKKVKYSKKRSQIDLKAITAVVLGYDFIGETVGKENKALMNRLTKLLLTKSRDWEYEEEVRTIHSIDDIDNDNIISDNEKYLLKMPQIRKVFIGCKADRDEVNKLKNEHHEIEFIYFIDSEKEYALLEDNCKA